ncbi:MAG TPA: tripartite tricarboxylate transporter substrate binding protein [Burkholderiales bacterium]|jgi:tripartite-type tricarboxylate transporter receptor subunit TctC|nr:tripartite tricarboxylate transporter substrate binding protein [Burkholderiales bacterium]
MLRYLHFVAIVFVLVTGGVTAAEPPYPTRPVRLIVGYPPGGSTDIAARMIGQRLTPVFHETVVIDNRAGASGTIGASIVMKSEPDGYTLSFAASPEVAIYRALMKTPPYDSLKDFVPVTLVGRVPFMLVVHPSVAANSVKELVALAKAKPGALNFASFGNGTSNHLVGEAFRAAAGINTVHIPYKGSAPAITDLLGGQVQMTFDTVPVVLPQVRAGKLKALAVATPKRSALAPDVPTMDEAGVAGFTGGTWFGVLAPARTPPAIVARLNKEIATILRAPDVVQTFNERGIEPVGDSAADFRAFIEAESRRWLKVAQDAGVKPE